MQDAGTETRNTETGHAETGSGTNARQQMRDVKDQVVGQAKNTFQQARDRATTSLDESRIQVANQVGNVAHAFRRTGEQLRGENQNQIAGLTETVAEQVEQVANYVRDRDPRAMREDLERLARHRPAAVIGGAFAIGLLMARFFKSSEDGAGDSGDGSVGGGYAAT
jgi:hypothetical protein